MTMFYSWLVKISITAIVVVGVLVWHKWTFVHKSDCQRYCPAAAQGSKAPAKGPGEVLNQLDTLNTFRKFIPFF